MNEHEPQNVLRIHIFSKSPIAEEGKGKKDNELGWRELLPRTGL
jgi:hypothetical protein